MPLGTGLTLLLAALPPFCSSTEENEHETFEKPQTASFLAQTVFGAAVESSSSKQPSFTDGGTPEKPEILAAATPVTTLPAVLMQITSEIETFQRQREQWREERIGERATFSNCTREFDDNSDNEDKFEGAWKLEEGDQGQTVAISFKCLPCDQDPDCISFGAYQAQKNLNAEKFLRDVEDLERSLEREALSCDSYSDALKCQKIYETQASLYDNMKIAAEDALHSGIFYELARICAFPDIFSQCQPSIPISPSAIINLCGDFIEQYGLVRDYANAAELAEYNGDLPAKPVLGINPLLEPKAIPSPDTLNKLEASCFNFIRSPIAP